MTRNAPDRRTFLAAAATVALSVAGCSTTTREPNAARKTPATLSGSSAVSTPTAPLTTGTATGALATALDSLERRTKRRIGIYALNTGNGTGLSYRAGELFPMCSTYKPLCVAAVLARDDRTALRRRIDYRRADLVDYSPITSRHVGRGMTVEQLCSAAIRYSDNTATNLLITHAGGPAQVTAFLRRLGDPITRVDRDEPAVNTAIPGDLRDTTTPRAIAADYLRLATTNTLNTEARASLVGWLRTNTTGDAQIRARVPTPWTVGDKTGSGDYGTTNDVAILWPPQQPPIALAILTTMHREDAEPDPTVIARIAGDVVNALQY